MITALFLTGCTKKDNQKIQITLIHGWGSNDADHQAMRQIYEDFEAEHPEIDVTIIALSSDMDVISKMRELLTVEKIPDIVFTAGEGRDTIYEFMVQKGYAVNLAPYLKEDESLRQNISPSILDYWMTEDGALYTVSDVTLMCGYWYNRTLFQQAGISSPPKTWEEFEHACQKLSELGNHTTPEMTPLLLDTNHIIYLTSAILCEESPTDLKNISVDSINFQSQGMQNTLTQLKQISKYCDIIDAYSFRDTLESFNNQETAIYINGVWGASLIDETVDAAYAAFPSKSGKSISMASSGVGYILGNTGDEQRVQASIEFLKYMLSPETAQRLINETKQIPSNPNILITDEIENERLYQAVSCVENSDIKIEFPSNFWSFELKNAYGNVVLLYLQNKIDAEHLQEELLKY